jgi:hypothetical protein
VVFEDEDEDEEGEGEGEDDDEDDDEGEDDIFPGSIWRSLCAGACVDHQL